MSKTPVEHAEEILGPLTERPRKIKCLFPDNHKHGDRRPSAMLYSDNFYCFSCGVSLSRFQYYCETSGLTPRQAFARLGVTNSSPPSPRPRDEALESFVRESVDASGIAPFRAGVGRG